MLHEAIAFLSSWFFISAYYYYLNRRARKKPDTSVHSLNASTRARWVKMVMGNNSHAILAIQTLRNSMMAANFMASTAILLMIGTLNGSDKISQWAAQHTFFVLPELPIALWQIKLGLLLLDFSIAFFCFSMSIRFFNHVGYMINLNSDDAALCHRTQSYLHKAGRYYSLGTRSFFFSFPIILWFFHAYLLLLGTLVLIIALALLDHLPDDR